MLPFQAFIFITLLILPTKQADKGIEHLQLRSGNETACLASYTGSRVTKNNMENILLFWYYYKNNRLKPR